MNHEGLLQLAAGRRCARSGQARRIRRAAGLSAAEVARAIGVSPATISRWERGKRRPRGQAALAYVQLIDDLTVARAGAVNDEEQTECLPEEGCP